MITYLNYDLPVLEKSVYTTHFGFFSLSNIPPSGQICYKINFSAFQIMLNENKEIENIINKDSL